MTIVTRSMFVIAVPDLAVSSAYYRDVLGFEVSEVGDPGWRMYDLGACRMLVGECPDAIPPRDTGDHSYFAYLIMEEIDSYYQTLKARSVEFVKTLRDEPWAMREFGIRTIDGHRIMFGMRVYATD
ncbi:VOC family protein [bacterium]|nr:VOC family protein [bacterium]